MIPALLEEIFSTRTVYDKDGNGFITRDEWGGDQKVFDAFDTNHDGKIGPDEMAAGLGAALRID